MTPQETAKQLREFADAIENLPSEVQITVRASVFDASSPGNLKQILRLMDRPRSQTSNGHWRYFGMFGLIELTTFLHHSLFSRCDTTRQIEEVVQEITEMEKELVALSSTGA